MEAKLVTESTESELIINTTQIKTAQTCFPHLVRVEAISLIAYMLFNLIKIIVLSKRITIMTSVIYENSKELEIQVGMLYGMLIKYQNATKLCWERLIKH